MKFKYKLRLFLLPAILVPAVMAIWLNFGITGAKIRTMEYKLLREKVHYIIRQCEMQHDRINSLKMEDVSYYQAITQRAVLQEAYNIGTESGINVIIMNTHSFMGVFFEALKGVEEGVFDSLAVEEMTQQGRGTREDRLNTPSGTPISTISAFAVFTPWHWLIIAQRDQRAVYRYLYDALFFSVIAIGLFGMLFIWMMWRWSNGIATSLERLEEGTMRLTAHEVDVVIEIPGHDEFAELAQRFNVMAVAVQQAQHDLKYALHRAGEANLALRENETLLKKVLDILPVGVWLADQDGTIRHGNPAGQRIWAGARYVGPEQFDQYKGWWAATGQPILPEEWALARAIKRGESSFEEEVEIQSFDGAHKIILNWAVPIWSQGHTIEGAVMVNQDITDRKRAEEQIREHNRLLKEAVEQKQHEMEALYEKLLRQEKLATIGQMAGSIAHELRNPLGAVKNSIFYLKQLKPIQHLTASTPKILRHLDMMNEELDTSERVIANLLDMTRMKPSQCEQIDFDELLQDALLRCHLPRQIAVTVELDPAPFLICADLLQLRQVLLNVLTNAGQAIEGSGAIRINAKRVIENRTTAISISDTGPGVEPDALIHVFEPLYTTRATGTGLGLAICKQIIENHQGRLTMTSEQGQGTTVTIVLPADRQGPYC